MKQSVKSAKLQHFPLCCSKTAKKTIQEEVKEEDSDVEAVKVEGGALPHTHFACHMPQMRQIWQVFKIINSFLCRSSIKQLSERRS